MSSPNGGGFQFPRFPSTKQQGFAARTLADASSGGGVASCGRLGSVGIPEQEDYSADAFSSFSNPVESSAGLYGAMSRWKGLPFETAAIDGVWGQFERHEKHTRTRVLALKSFAFSMWYSIWRLSGHPSSINCEDFARHISTGSARKIHHAALEVFWVAPSTCRYPLEN